MKSNSFFVATSAALMVLACGKSDDGGKKHKKSNAPEATVLSAGIGKIANAFDSAAALSGGTGFMRAYTLSDPAWKDYTDECDPQKSGWPKGFGDDAGNQGGTFAYNAAFVSCLMKQPDNAGETIMGAIMAVGGMACALGDSLVFDGKEHEMSLPVTTTCYAQSFVDFLNNEVGITAMPVVVTGSLKEFYGNTTGEWTGSVRIKSTMTIQSTLTVWDRVILFKETKTGFAVHVVDGPESTGMIKPYGNSFAAAYDSESGTVRYEYRRPKTTGESEGEWGTRHGRAILTGTLDSATGAFTALANFELIYGNLSYSPSYPQNPNGSGALKTVKGNPTDGFYLNTFESVGQNNDDPFSTAKYTNPLSGCFPEGTSCTGNTGIVFDADADYLFLMKPNVATDNETWFSESVPLAFTAVEPTEKP